jgi:ComF family protein
VQPPSGGQLAGIPLVAAARLEGAFQQAIHTYKYRSRPALGDYLARHLLTSVRRAGIQLEALTFVPLHPERARQRGFNQAERLARSLGRELRLPVVDGLSRIRATVAQVGLTGHEREANVAGAFRWTASGAPPAATGLVDDVCTTGATLLAAAKALNTAGGRVGAFLVLAVPHTLSSPLVTLPE